MEDRLNPDVLLTKALRDVPMTYLECRDARHVWKILKDLYATGEEHYFGMKVQRELECQRCNTRKTDYYAIRHLSNSMVVRLKSLGSYYTYPEGYILPEMARALHSTEILRAERYRRLVAAK